MSGGVFRLERLWLIRFVVTLVCVFAPLYVATRSSTTVGDSMHYIDVAQQGDPAAMHFGNPGHFMQGPLARALSQGLGALGFSVSIESLFIALAVVGTLAAMVFVGLIAAEFARTTTAAWVGSLLFATSLHVWTQVNGEQYGLALGFLTAAVWLALRGRVIPPAICWALAVTAHSDFIFVAPALVMAVWMTRPTAPAASRVASALVLVTTAALLTLVIILVWSRAIGKWSTVASLVEWIDGIRAVDQQYFNSRPEPIRALKGLVTAFTVAGHFWRDITTGRGSWNGLFLAESGVGAVILAVASLGVAAVASSQRRLLLFGLVWIAPFHLFGSWWFQSTVEKYHAGPLPGLVLLVTGGLVQLADRTRHREIVLASYVGVFAALNFFGAVLPMQNLGERRIEAEREIRRLNEERGGRAVFVTCDAPAAVVRAGVTHYRLRAFWTGTVPEIQARLLAWTKGKAEEGYEPYLVGRWCYPEDWKTQESKAPFDLFFLERSFRMTPTGIREMPIDENSPTNPFSWRRGDVLRLEPTGRVP